MMRALNDIDRNDTDAIRSFISQHFDINLMLNHIALVNTAGTWDDNSHNYYIYQRLTDNKQEGIFIYYATFGRENHTALHSINSVTLQMKFLVTLRNSTTISFKSSITTDRATSQQTEQHHLILSTSLRTIKITLHTITSTLHY
jgi:hypothetical protein